jgi:dipeptidyl-peptidase-4
LWVIGACGGASPPAPVAAVASSVAPACAPPVPASASDPELPVRLAATQGFRAGAPRRAFPTEDGRLVLFLRSDATGRGALWELDVASGRGRELVTPEDILGGAEETISAEERARRERQRVRGGGFTTFQASRDGALVLLGLSGRLFAYTRKTGKARELPTGDGVIDPQLSPDATRVAYVRGHDVHVLSLAGGPPSAITRGGTELRPHGLAEYMAMEELYRDHGFWWSPDGRELLVQSSDLSAIPEWTYLDPAHPERPAQRVRYPVVGAPHAVVALSLVAVDAPRRAPRKVTWDDRAYPYLHRVAWTANAPPTLVVSDRRMKRVAVLAVDARSGATRTLVTEEDPTWVEQDPSMPRWLPDGSGFLWSTDRGGAFELELRDREGAKTATVAAGIGYRHLAAVDGERRLAYVTAGPAPSRTELWVAPLDGSGAPRVVSRVADGQVFANFGGGARVYTYAESSLSGGPRYGVRDVDGKEIAALPWDAPSPPYLPEVELAEVGPDAVRVAIVRPRSFDPRRRYPVLVHVYGAPISILVRADAYAYFEQQWLADTVDAIVVSADTRGTRWRGRDWQRAFYLHYGDVPVDGQAEAVALLGQRYPEMDVTRVGIYGWSNGGYVSAMAIFRRPEVFKAAVAGAPVADLRDYDAIMEWFFGPPGDPSWDEHSLLTWAARPPTAERPARPLLLIHGTADDNVFLAHALKLAAAMGLAGRPVDFMPLVDQTHMVSAPESAAAVSRRIAAHFRTHLVGPSCR